MIITTTPTIEGHTIKEYKGLVSGEVIFGMNFLKDIGASLRDFFGGRTSLYEQDMPTCVLSYCLLCLTIKIMCALDSQKN